MYIFMRDVCISFVFPKISIQRYRKSQTFYKEIILPDNFLLTYYADNVFTNDNGNVSI